jgi:hypothetical protein
LSSNPRMPMLHQNPPMLSHTNMQVNCGLLSIWKSGSYMHSEVEQTRNPQNKPNHLFVPFINMLVLEHWSMDCCGSIRGTMWIHRIFGQNTTTTFTSDRIKPSWKCKNPLAIIYNTYGLEVRFMLEFMSVAHEVWLPMLWCLTKPFAMLIIPFLIAWNHGKRLPTYDFRLEWCKDPKPTMMSSIYFHLVNWDHQIFNMYK